MTALHQTYGTNLQEAGYTSGTADDRPEVLVLLFSGLKFCIYFIWLLLTNLDCLQLRAYYLGEFGRKLKLELHCITSQVITDQCKLRNNLDSDFDWR